MIKNEKIIEIKLEIRGSFRGWERTPVFVTMKLDSFWPICNGKNHPANYAGIANCIVAGIVDAHPTAIKGRWNWKGSCQGNYIERASIGA